MEHYDRLQTQPHRERQEAFEEALPHQIRHARQNAPAYARLLADIDPAAIRSVKALASLPVTRKSTLAEQQAARPPFGGFAASPSGELARVFQSPGPLYEPEGQRSDYWRFGRALFTAGFRGGDLIHNTFSYHFTPAGFMVESGAMALGCPVFPAGIGQTELQVGAIRDLRPAGYAGTPSFLKAILDRAAEMSADVSSITRALVSGEALPPSLRELLAERGVRTRQCYATADLGLIAFETDALEGLVVDEGVIVEIVRPGSGDPVAEGEVGEVLVTTFNPDYPLIRFATGDLSAILPGQSPCGCTNTRIRGWLGRADQSAKVRGMFVQPTQIAAVLARHPELLKGRLVVDREDHNDTMLLRCETHSQAEGLAGAVAESVREVCKLRTEVELLGPGELPNDGKVIDDIRRYD